MKQVLGPVNMVVRRNGWIYIYLSNESAQDVFFDNLVGNLRHGPLVEQTDYYSFGMAIPGLSTQAYRYNYSPNRYTYNGKELQSKEFSDNSGLEDYDYGARMYDPQICRWIRPDPLADKMRRFSTYDYAFDNPVRFIDPDGMAPTSDFYDKDGNLVKHEDDLSNATYQQTGSGVNLHYELKGFDENQGGLNKVNLTTAIQEAQNLNEDNSSLEPENGSTYCNYATQNVLKTVASATDNSSSLNI